VHFLLSQLEPPHVLYLFILEAEEEVWLVAFRTKGFSFTLLTTLLVFAVHENIDSSVSQQYESSEVLILQFRWRIVFHVPLSKVKATRLSLLV